jgi:hypothetical protein
MATAKQRNADTASGVATAVPKRRTNGASTRVKVVTTTGVTVPAKAGRPIPVPVATAPGVVVVDAADAGAVQAERERLKKTNGKPSAARAPMADPMALIDAALLEVTELESDAQPARIEDIAAVALDAARDGMRSSHAAAKEWPAGAAVEVCLFCLPETWRDDEARALLAKLSETEQALLMSWLGAQFWDGYGAGQTHAQTKPPIDMRQATT